MSDIQLHLGDCLDVMAGLPTRSVDAVICDLPYGTTQCRWDSVIPFEPLWSHYKRILKPRGAVVLTASQPFTSELVMSNREWFRYEWILEKAKPVGHLNAKIRPMLAHESILVFSEGGETYSPQGLKPTLASISRTNNGAYGNCSKTTIQTTTGYPRSVLKFAHDESLGHPTQKPVALMEYLIRTYANPGDVILDNCCGSGTTLVACVNTDRRGIGIEKDPSYFEIAEQRIADARMRLDRPHAPPLRLKATADACSLFDVLEES